MLFPDIHQLVMRRNPNYLNSVWIGFSAPLLNLPGILWHTIVRPVLRGLATCVRLCSLPVLGILGIVSAEEITIEQAFLRAIAKAGKQ